MVDKVRCSCNIAEKSPVGAEHAERHGHQMFRVFCLKTGRCADGLRLNNIVGNRSLHNMVNMIITGRKFLPVILDFYAHFTHLLLIMC